MEKDAEGSTEPAGRYRKSPLGKLAVRAVPWIHKTDELDKRFLCAWDLLYRICEVARERERLLSFVLCDFSPGFPVLHTEGRGEALEVETVAYREALGNVGRWNDGTVGQSLGSSNTFRKNPFKRIAQA